METSSLKKFALQARRMLLEQVQNQLELVLQPDSRARRDSQKAVVQLQKQIDLSSREQVIEQAAYTWFNRFCALRFMDANRYTRIGTVSPAEGFHQPEILAEAKQGHIEEELQIDRAQVMGLLDGTLPSNDPQQEAYRLLLVATCNQYHSLMPFLFEQIADYTELLMPDDLLSDNSILTQLRNVLTAEVCQDVEVIGWLYQFYIADKKDDVFAALKKGKKITPENIPAATQLFTPHWIVRYLVENSLGRLWMLNHPESKLFQNMKDRGEDCYYIEPEEPETDFLQISSPEEIKICDPACGSGHMLTYAFDLLYAIYEEQGYQASDIPRLILTHNLYGVEIDQRAGALAAFALTMKAREKYRRFLQPDKVVQPHICVLENIQIDPEDLSAYMDKVGRDLFSGGLQGVVNQWEEADNFGSLIRPLVTDVTDVLELLRERKLGEDLFLADIHQKVLKALKQADYLSPKYHVVVANPPYMGSKQMNPDLKTWCVAESEIANGDLFAMFIERLMELLVEGGFQGMITMHSWMFISEYEGLRHWILTRLSINSLAHLGARAFDQISGERVQTAAFVFERRQSTESTGTYLRLVNGQNEQEKRSMFSDKTVRFHVTQRKFSILDWKPLIYWISDALRSAFHNGTSLREISKPKKGFDTGANSARYFRYWWEVDNSGIFRGGERLSDCRWVETNKGGQFRKWHGNRENIVTFANEGRSLYEIKGANIRNKSDYFKSGLTYTIVTSSDLSFRESFPESIFYQSGGTIVAENQELRHQLLGTLNSVIANEVVSCICPTTNSTVDDVAKFPVMAQDLWLPEYDVLVSEACSLSQEDYEQFEESWNFPIHPVILYKSDKLDEAVSSCLTSRRESAIQLQTIETKLNQVSLDAYGVADEFSAYVEMGSVSLSGNPYFRYGSDKSESELEALLLADTMREFISYAVGCMLGRYSLDKPGLILANQGETADDYRQQIPDPTFAPDEDNVIPLLDGDWFEDEISARFKAFLKITFGAEHFEENLTFLEDGLYPENKTGKKRKTIRDYFLKEFYNHHVKLYKKRPIYWLFSSPKGTFNALIYMHRYRPDTISVVLNDYLREFQTKLRNEIERLQSVADSATAAKSDKAKALKKVTQYKKDLKELEEYERDVLYPLASERIEIDLDDGVKVNYNKFGTALKKVTGLTGKA